jgi:hypothetical protein
MKSQINRVIFVIIIEYIIVIIVDTGIEFHRLPDSNL